MMNSKLFGAFAGLALLVSVGSAEAAPLTYATEAFWQNNGTVGTSNGRDNPLNALGAPDGNFLALGLTNANGTNRGIAVFGFGAAFAGGGSVFEITFGCANNGTLCTSHDEQVEIYVGNSFVDDGAFDLSGFQSAGLVGNGEAQSGASFTFSGGPFTYLALVDRSALLLNSESTDGFDLDAVGVRAVPEPGSLALFGLGLLALFAFTRQRTANLIPLTLRQKSPGRRRVGSRRG